MSQHPNKVSCPTCGTSMKLYGKRSERRQGPPSAITRLKLWYNDPAGCERSLTYNVISDPFGNVVYAPVEDRHSQYQSVLPIEEVATHVEGVAW